MTYEEALEITNSSIRQFKIIAEQENGDYLLRIKMALEKQIPMKPKHIMEVNGMYGFICPVCGEYNGYYATKESMRTKRCANINCGQAILWEE